MSNIIKIKFYAARNLNKRVKSSREDEKVVSYILKGYENEKRLRKGRAPKNSPIADDRRGSFHGLDVISIPLPFTRIGTCNIFSPSYTKVTCKSVIQLEVLWCYG